MKYPTRTQILEADLEKLQLWYDYLPGPSNDIEYKLLVMLGTRRFIEERAMQSTARREYVRRNARRGISLIDILRAVWKWLK